MARLVVTHLQPPLVMIRPSSSPTTNRRSEVAVDARPGLGDAADPQPPADSTEGVQRFAIVSLVAVAAAAVPFLWVLWDLWNGTLNPLRTAESSGYASNFYDIQARALLRGHLWVPNGSLGLEAFVHDGRQYTYFGLFPSLIRLPVLLMTHSLDGRLTAPSMLLAWLTTALFTALLMWKVRFLIRGSQASLPWLEATSYGILLAAVLAGTVLVVLAAEPWVFSEDVAWSIALTVGSVFALLGVLERPSWRRVSVAGGLVLAANLTRGTTGYACVIGAIVVAGWFGLSRQAKNERQWAVPTLLAGLIPLGVGCLVSYAKFGILFGLPASSQLVYQAFRFRGSYFNVHFLPSTLLAYFRPNGLRLTPVFPFITLPSSITQGVGGVSLFGSDRTASVPGSMPLLFVLAIWGMVTTYRPRPVARADRFRIPVLTTILAGATIMVYGWIEDRFLGDLLPFLILAGAIGMVDLWRRLERGRTIRWASLATVSALGLFGVVANVGMANTPTTTWSNTQFRRYVEFQRSVSDVTGHPLQSELLHGPVLPAQAPVDQLLVTGNCAALYISLGGGRPPRHIFILDALDVRTVWYPVESGPPITATDDITLHQWSGAPQLLPLVSLGKSTLDLQRIGPGEVRFSLHDPFAVQASAPIHLPSARPNAFTITADPGYHLVAVSRGTQEIFSGFLSSSGVIVRHTTKFEQGGLAPPITVSEVPEIPNMSLCRSLL